MTNLERFAEAARRAAKNPLVTLVAGQYGYLDEFGCTGCIMSAVAFDGGCKFDNPELSLSVENFIQENFGISGTGITGIVLGWNRRDTSIAPWAMKTEEFALAAQLREELLP